MHMQQPIMHKSSTNVWEAAVFAGSGAHGYEGGASVVECHAMRRSTVSTWLPNLPHTPRTKSTLWAPEACMIDGKPQTHVQRNTRESVPALGLNNKTLRALIAPYTAKI